MERFNCNILVLRRALNENSIISSSHSVTSYKALCRLYTNFTSKDVFMHTAEYLVTCFVLATVMQYRHHCQFSTTKFFYSNRINDLLLFLFCFVFLFSASRCFFFSCSCYSFAISANKDMLMTSMQNEQFLPIIWVSNHSSGFYIAKNEGSGFYLTEKMVQKLFYFSVQKYKQHFLVLFSVIF